VRIADEHQELALRIAAKERGEALGLRLLAPGDLLSRSAVPPVVGFLIGVWAVAQSEDLPDEVAEDRIACIVAGPKPREAVARQPLHHPLGLGGIGGVCERLRREQTVAERAQRPRDLQREGAVAGGCHAPR
jgi:hypothetical protein